MAIAAPDLQAVALYERIDSLAAEGHALERVLEEVLLRWGGVPMATIEAARELAADAARDGVTRAVRTAFLLGLVGRTGLFQ
jgi:hypothetical protein